MSSLENQAVQSISFGVPFTPLVSEPTTTIPSDQFPFKAIKSTDNTTSFLPMGFIDNLLGELAPQTAFGLLKTLCTLTTTTPTKDQEQPSQSQILSTQEEIDELQDMVLNNIQVCDYENGWCSGDADDWSAKSRDSTFSPHIQPFLFNLIITNHLPNLTKLSFSFRVHNHDPCREVIYQNNDIFSNALMKMTKLKSLKLSGIIEYPNPPLIPHIFPISFTHPTLCELFLCGYHSQIGIKDVQYFGQTDGKSMFPVLTTLDLSDNSFLDYTEDCNNLISWLESIPNLINLNLGRVGLRSSTIEKRLSQSSLLSRLESLDLSFNYRSTSSLSILFKSPHFMKNTTLHTLILDQNYSTLEPAIFQSLAECSGLSQVKVLSLLRINLPVNDLKVLFAPSSYLKQLTTLRIDYANDGDETLQFLSTSPFFSNLTELAISGQGITSKGLASFTNSTSLTQLITLRLRELNIIPNTISLESFQSFIKCTNLSNLTTFDAYSLQSRGYNGNGDDDYDDDNDDDDDNEEEDDDNEKEEKCVPTIGQMIATSPSLQKLIHLNLNRNGAKIGRYLFELINNCPELKTLNLSSSSINDASFKKMYQDYKKYQKNNNSNNNNNCHQAFGINLNELILDENDDLHDDGIDYLCKFFPSLTKLSIYENDSFTPKILTHINNSPFISTLQSLVLPLWDGVTHDDLYIIKNNPLFTGNVYDPGDD